MNPKVVAQVDSLTLSSPQEMQERHADQWVYAGQRFKYVLGEMI